MSRADEVDGRPGSDSSVLADLVDRLTAKIQAGEAIAAYRDALRLKPDFARAHNNLGTALDDQGKHEEAEKEYREALRLKPDFAMAHANLGNALDDQGKHEEAEKECREALRLKPDFAVAHNNLGSLLGKKGQLDEAIKEYRAAIALDPKYAVPHDGLGIALQSKGKLDEAIQEHRAAIALDPKLAVLHYNIGVALREKGKPDEAIEEYRRAIALDPKAAMHHNALGNALLEKGQLDEAIGELRAVIALDPKAAMPHNNLGALLQSKGKLDEAVQEYRAAIALDPKAAMLHGALGQTLALQGRFAEARDANQRCLDLLPPGDALRQLATQQLQQCKQFLVLDQKLAAILEDKEKPAETEWLALAWLCQQPFKKLYAASARFYAEAFAEKPQLADDLSTGNRYNAACAAALAGCGQGKDAGSLDEKEQARLRAQALKWLRTDLRAWRRLLGTGPDSDRPAIAQQLQHWLEDSDFAGVRGEKALLVLPEAERADWQKLWQEVEALRKQAAQQP